MANNTTKKRKRTMKKAMRGTGGLLGRASRGLMGRAGRIEQATGGGRKRTAKKKKKRY